ncbi:MAG: ABC transporter permease [Planctomycetota bacterium]|nr:ABC transporter permease [Planctomycetota bacterium]
MYKYLLCWRYLRTRYIALASIISVTLGVATMIVVNSVMSGFTTEMMDRMRGIMSDMTFDAQSLEGFADSDWHMNEIRRVAGDQIEGLTPTVHVPAMLSYSFRGQTINKQILLIGIDETTHANVSDFAKYLQHPANRNQLGFALHEGGYDTVDHLAPDNAVPRPDLEHAGWEYRRVRARIDAEEDKQIEAAQARARAAQGKIDAGPEDPFSKSPDANKITPFNAAENQHTGIIVGKGLISAFKADENTDRFLIIPGDDAQITVPSAGRQPKGISGAFTVVDVYESKMSEYDSSFVFVPLRKLQEMRGMIDPTTDVGNVTSIQIKLKEGADLDTVRDKLRAAFPSGLFRIDTWRDKQSPLLAAVQMEKAVLNILLFLIIAVAGFGILAIFFMIVVEKTRDIGVLKSLGASRRGIMGIFLSYGLSLGMVGAGAGMVLGLLFVHYINEIRDVLEWVSGQKVFDPSIYYFFKIPTMVEPLTVTWVVLGALAIAVLASILPAQRAARLHPVEALRHE